MEIWKHIRFHADLTKTSNGKWDATLGDCLLDEDILGFVGAYLFDDVETVKESTEIMKFFFSDLGNYEKGDTTLPMNWNNWNEE